MMNHVPVRGFCYDPYVRCARAYPGDGEIVHTSVVFLAYFRMEPLFSPPHPRR